jgi:hypothetical protein
MLSPNCASVVLTLVHGVMFKHRMALLRKLPMDPGCHSPVGQPS